MLGLARLATTYFFKDVSCCSLPRACAGRGLRFAGTLLVKICTRSEAVIPQSPYTSVRRSMAQDLHLDPATLATLTAISAAPWVVKPLWGEACRVAACSSTAQIVITRKKQLPEQ